MNDLSWLIYLAEVSGKALDFAGAFFILGVVTVSFIMILAMVDVFDIKNLKPYVRTIGISIGTAMLLIIVIPSENTVYAIAASELGEQAITSETGGKAVKALNTWLDKQIGEEDVVQEN